ncbi:MAG: exosortase H-associated membrane protein [Casimicrobiaceae bacterium]
MKDRPLLRFVVLVLAWLPPAFGAWYLLAPVILWPAQMLVTAVAHGGFGDLVRSVEAHGATVSFVTTLKPGRADAAGILSVDVNMLLYAFGLPLFVALTLAAREGAWWRKLLAGYVVMLPFIAWGVIADFLKNVAITASPLVASQTGFSALDRDIIAFAYQFGSLILPAVVPAVAWVLMHRGFLERLRAPAPGARRA